ncbi:MAG: FecCD family ABC transporter permease [Lentisphaeria bacterium]
MTTKTFLFITLSIVAVITATFFGPLGWNIPSQIFWQQRVPRVAIGFIVGGGLACCGLIFQNLFNSPLATPFTLGTSSGAAFGAAIAIALFGAKGIGHGTFPIVSICAMAGALLSIFLISTLYKLKRNCTMGDLLLAGVAINFFFSSALLLIQFICDYSSSFQIVNWLMGKISHANIRTLASSIPIFITCLIMFTQHRKLDQLQLGEELAWSRGINVEQTRKKLFFLTAITVAIVVAICGPVGFVGMMAPHICKKIFPMQYRILLPTSFIFGGAFLAMCDAFARTLIAPAEIPVGIITSLLGGPFFIFLLLKKN